MKTADLLHQFQLTRTHTEQICEPLEIEDYIPQPIADVSPPKWHLGHTTWFFEQFILVPFAKNYQIYHEDFAFLFNSYYNHAGKRVLRPNRGLMSRPPVREVMKYRAYISEAMVDLLNNPIENPEILERIELGINHEQQHQELLIYDLKYILGYQPTFPVYGSAFQTNETSRGKLFKVPEGLYEVGFEGSGFSYDNEHGRHKVFLEEFEISDQLVSNGEYLEFIEAGGYENFDYWLDEGLSFIRNEGIKAPLYWHLIEGEWQHYTLSGLQKINPELPVQHVSYYEAQAYAAWKGLRLPSEFEWEIASEKFDWGQLWEWTGSAYLPYPRFKKAPGALGEYNGKFMVNQQVLRGASVATATGHSRPTYRNFFHPAARWIFSGIRLAK
ncbi:ergothioneine biosynthesis protein EgtB [Algoriphagus hitonicola]|uniref:Ergothioneine biosynthesis protein EgtB n=1 Tax=Algoriphagus hitonicola TaxID=435880 RepID=A0A1I2T042_9BACT|nr:ergothioneine biosynthesis protein EgtB [Algoriphagus hitonicola]SFG58435.1 ergothioneine biosynthesis protein EgtB [Algoriphagus hitonicola]